MNSFLVLNRGLNGVKRVATALVLEDNWFTSPMKERSSVWLVGTGYFEMASVMDGSIW